jgi:hypothetical protein
MKRASSAPPPDTTLMKKLKSTAYDKWLKEHTIPPFETIFLSAINRAREEAREGAREEAREEARVEAREEAPVRDREGDPMEDRATTCETARDGDPHGSP